MGIQIDLDKCVGCGDCVPVCPFGLLEIVDDKVQLKEGCTLCGACQEACSYEAICIEAIPETEIASDSHRGIWVFAETRKGRLKSAIVFSRKLPKAALILKLPVQKSTRLLRDLSCRLEWRLNLSTKKMTCLIFTF